MEAGINPDKSLPYNMAVSISKMSVLNNYLPYFDGSVHSIDFQEYITACCNLETLPLC